MIADITADGRLIASTGADWEYTLDPRYTGRRTTGYDTQFLEDFDSRKTPSGWRSAAVKPADYTFYPCPVKTLAVYKKYPVFCKRLVNGGWFYDFGEELTGSLHIVAQGKSGQTLRILCSEECTPDGRAMYNMRCNCKYEEFWTLSGKTDRLEQYDYKAFRYAEILSDDNLPFEIISVSAAARHYPFPENSCVLSCSDRTLCSVFNICKAGVKLGSQEVFVDCPSREKGQYSGDIAIAGAAHLLLTGDGSLFKKAIENQAQSLKIAPGMLAVSPGSFMQEIADYSLQFPLSVWRYYRYTGDINFLKAMALPCRKTVEYFKQFSRSDGLLEQVNEKWNMVDWLKTHATIMISALLIL